VVVAGNGAVVVVDGVGKAPTPVAGPVRQESPVRLPEPLGMVTVAQLAPSLVLRARTPVTWLRSVTVWPVTQQLPSSVHETAVGPDMPAGRLPPWVQVAPELVDTRATEPMAVVRPPCTDRRGRR